ncbi:hypothetical protein Pmani_029303 [Petrolisthes manimaculis]|uniref:Uncharacterized protein n=1 Tax=Petrolisthes manimaculis TaxID=1843537 RepID=A0AAE1NZU6_9EUCA|nr:hypothetical protein Pmani_029303 [Petrolisthes manimaculis]
MFARLENKSQEVWMLRAGLVMRSHAVISCHAGRKELARSEGGGTGGFSCCLAECRRGPQENKPTGGGVGQRERSPRLRTKQQQQQQDNQWKKRVNSEVTVASEGELLARYAANNNC